jgi:hypothetical protein
LQFAIAVATDADSWRVVRRAEELGFARAWFYDTQMLSADPFVAMAAAAVKTTKIRLGTGVLIPSNRIAPVTANAFASLNKLAPGRIDFGVGTGFTGRRAMGLGAVKLADMDEYVRVTAELIRRTTYTATEKEIRERFAKLTEAGYSEIGCRSSPARSMRSRIGAGSAVLLLELIYSHVSSSLVARSLTMRRAKFCTDKCGVTIHAIGATLVSSGEIKQLLLRVRQMALASDLANPYRQITIMFAFLPPNPIAGHPSRLRRIG